MSGPGGTRLGRLRQARGRLGAAAALGGALAAATCAGACLGSAAIERSYYVLHGVTLKQRQTPIAGLVRVRNLDAASIYEKFQIVVRRSPYELAYSETDVWAVKPNRMISDVLAEALGAASAFTSVARELGELRPEYILSGDLHAIEVYVSEDLWFAHVAIVLQLSRYEDGQTLLTYKFDERKEVPNRTFSLAARACSELLSSALDAFIAAIERLDLPRADPGSAKGLMKPSSRDGSDSDDDEPPGLSDDPHGEAGPEGNPLDGGGARSDGPRTIFVPVSGRGEPPPE